MKNAHYDFIIIGGGAAGFAAAIKADALKVKTLMVSGGAVPLGGTCINVGCMPSKRLLATAEAYWNARHSKYDGISDSAPSLNFKKIVESKDALIQKLQGKAYAGTLKFLTYVALKEGDARFIDGHTVDVNGEKITGEKFLISTGSSTFIPPIAGLDKVHYLTNIEALSLKELPKSMVILGGGPLGLEFAQIYSRFGTKVTILEYESRIAAREEPELGAFLKQKLEGEGIVVHTDAKTKSVKQKENMIEVMADTNGEETIIEAEKILVAAGVRANTDSLRFEEAGVGVGKNKGIVVNEMMQSSVPHIYAAGDVIDQAGNEINPKLETVAGREGFVAASNALENKNIKMDFHSTPHAIFTDPPLAGVGLTEAQIAKQGDQKYSSKTLNLNLVPKAHILEAADGIIKMVIDSKTEEVVGIHMAGARADEVISVASFILKNHLKLNDIIENTFIFPTMAESIKWVAQSFRKDVSKLSCCTE